MCRALVLVHELMNELYSCVARLFRLMNKRTIFMCSALVSVQQLKNKEYLCVAHLFWFMN